jgi:hypothetical protein
VSDFDLQYSYLRQVDGWRDELVEIGKALDATDYVVGFERAVNHVRDLRCRVRQVCRELNIYYHDDDPIAVLIRKVQEAVK